MDAALLARIEQVCCLGLDGQVFIPALLRELHALVPSSNNVFHWVNERQQVINVFSEIPPGVLPRYLSEFLNKREREAFPGVSELVARYSGAFTMEEIAYENYYQSAFYNEIMRPADYRYLAAVVIREQNRALGMIVLHRGHKDRPFQDKEKNLLESLIPFIAHGMNNAVPVHYPLVEHPDSGLMILDQKKRVHYVSPRARYLLFLSQHPQVVPDSVKDTGLTIPLELISVIDRLQAIYHHSPMSTPPVWRHKNPWGGFIFRAHWLDPVNGPDTGMIGVTIQHQEPAPLKVMRLAKKLGLTPKQVQVCSLLTAGQAYPKIGERLHVSTHTVTDHVRKLFEKLEVFNRSELVTKILSA